jgi:hypothetical protein
VIISFRYMIPFSVRSTYLLQLYKIGWINIRNCFSKAFRDLQINCNGLKQSKQLENVNHSAESNVDFPLTIEPIVMKSSFEN